MPKKQPKTVTNRDKSSIDGRKPLKIVQIRELAEHLRSLPHGAPLPDWTWLSMGNRVAIAAELVTPASQRAELLGKSLAQIARYRKGGEIPMQFVAALARHAELPVEWLVLGRETERKPPLVHVTPDAPAGDSTDVLIRRLAFRASAGRGNLILDEDAGHLRFPRSILQRIGVTPHNARMLEASGQSMAPTINDGDLMVVDISASEITDGNIYLFSIGNEVFVKRLRRSASALMMSSDNRDLFPAEEPVPTELPLRIYGRVKWVGRSV